jgi:hypothetical protein
MPRKKVGPPTYPSAAAGGLAEQLAAELKSARESGQPVIYEQEFPTGKARVTVIWDAWAHLPLEARTAVILRAYELAEGSGARERIALASGLTVPEAQAAGMLPYQILPALRKGDPLTSEQARQAMLDEGASALLSPDAPQLRFATEEEAQAARRRLIRRFPGSEEVWLLTRDLPAADFAAASDWAPGGEA